MKQIKLNLLRQERENRDWTQDMLATFSGLSSRTIQRIESGGTATPETAKALASAFGMKDYSMLMASQPSTPSSPDHASVSFSPQFSAKEKGDDKKDNVPATMLSESDVALFKILKMNLIIVGTLALILITLRMLSDPALHEAFMAYGIYPFGVFLALFLFAQFKAKVLAVPVGVLGIVITSLTTFTPFMKEKVNLLGSKVEYVEMASIMREITGALLDKELEKQVNEDTPVDVALVSDPDTQSAFRSLYAMYNNSPYAKECAGEMEKTITLSDFYDLEERFALECEPAGF